MFAKAACISLHTLAAILSFRPPASSNTKEKEDKVKDEGLFSTVILRGMQFGQSAAVIVTAIYILLMHRGIIPGTLKPWQALTTATGVTG
ncbi:hypothetical protein BX616_008637, partial [Lobosporangium transversale]